MSTKYTTTTEYLQDVQTYIQLLLRLEILQHKESVAWINTHSIPDSEITMKENDDMYYSVEEQIQDSTVTLKNHYAAIEQKINNSTKGRCMQLRQLFRLDTVELLILAVCVLMQRKPVNRRIARELTGASLPTIEFLDNSIYYILDEDAALRNDYLAPAGNLFKNNLLEIVDTHSMEAGELKATDQARVPQRVLDYLFEKDTISHELASYARLRQPGEEINARHIPESVMQELRTLLKKQKMKQVDIRDTLFCFQGERGTGKEATAEWLCGQLRQPLITVDVEQMLNNTQSFSRVLRLLRREGMLLNGILYYRGVEHLMDKTRERELKEFVRQAREYAGTQIITSREAMEISRYISGKDMYTFEFNLPEYKKREELWRDLTARTYTIHANVNLDSFANKFKLSGGQIQQAFRQAYNLSQLRDIKEKGITADDLNTACRMQSTHKLAELAVKIDPNYDWDDIILAENSVQQLREMVSRANLRHTVYGDWEHDKKHSLGKGLTALFSGPSGTGKTMAAEIIAKELQLDLYKIDLSTVVSKYIGETEKNLSKIFKEAEASNAILFFDEADALFGTRSEVKDSHDRYANIEVGFFAAKNGRISGHCNSGDKPEAKYGPGISAPHPVPGAV